MTQTTSSPSSVSGDQPGPVGRRRSNIEIVIPTFNEQLNLAFALASVVDWADTVYVVDSESTDRTRQIAEQYGAQVVVQPWLGYAKQKNWALENLPLSSDWVFILDSDESITPGLRDEIMSIAARPVAEVPESGFYVNRLTYFLGKPIRHCGYYPSYNLRFFKRGKASYEEREVHEHMVVQGATARLSNQMLHEDRRGLEHFIAKHNRYSTLEARELRREERDGKTDEPLDLERGITVRRWLKRKVLPRLPLTALWRFFYMYVLRLGVLDGAAGLRFCLLVSTYDLFISLKLAETRAMEQQIASGGSSDSTATLKSIAALAVPEGTVTATSPAYRAVEASTIVPDVSDNGVQPTHEGRRLSSGELSPPVHPATEEERREHERPARGPSPQRSPGALLARAQSPYTLKQKIARVAWTYMGQKLYRFTFHNWYGLRAVILRCFGAKLGKFVRLRPTAHFEQPWNLTIGDNSVIGDNAIIYCLGKVKIGAHVTISQNAHICAGSHDFTLPDLPLLRLPITIMDHVWIAADAFVGPGITVGEGVLLGARGCAVKNLQEWTIYAGNPARAIRPRPKFDLVEISGAPPVEQG